MSIWNCTEPWKLNIKDSVNEYSPCVLELDWLVIKDTTFLFLFILFCFIFMLISTKFNQGFLCKASTTHCWLHHILLPQQSSLASSSLKMGRLHNPLLSLWLNIDMTILYSSYTCSHSCDFKSTRAISYTEDRVSQPSYLIFFLFFQYSSLKPWKEQWACPIETGYSIVMYSQNLDQWFIFH